MKFSLLIIYRLIIHHNIAVALTLSLSWTIYKEAAVGGGGGGGAILHVSGTGLSGSKRDDKESNLFLVPRED